MLTKKNILGISITRYHQGLMQVVSESCVRVVNLRKFDLYSHKRGDAYALIK